jgi:hypothetical protein
MTTIEKKIIDFIVNRRHLLFLAFVILVGAVIRLAGRNFMSADMLYCLRPWFDQIRDSGGLSALSSQVGDYGLLYQTIISLMTYVDVFSAYQYKMLSVAFDVAMAVMVAVIYRDIKLHGLSGKDVGHQVDSDYRKSVLFHSCVVAAVVWLLPTVIVNSAYWGQCDSMYTFFCLATLYWLRKGSFVTAFVFLGLAFSCKLQTIFFVPFIGTYYLVSKRFSVFNVLISVAVLWLSGAVAFAYGRSLLEPWTIYCNQAADYCEMYLNFSSSWVILGNDYSALKWFAILITLSLVVMGAFVCMNNKHFLDEKEDFYCIAAWFVWTMVLFLPSMHDRYAYSLDIMLFLIGFMHRRYLKYAILSMLTGFYHYGYYLIDDRYEEPIVLAAVYLLAYLHFTMTLYKQLKERQPVVGD